MKEHKSSKVALISNVNVNLLLSTSLIFHNFPFPHTKAEAYMTKNHIFLRVGSKKKVESFLALFIKYLISDYTQKYKTLKLHPAMSNEKVTEARKKLQISLAQSTREQEL